MKKGFHDSYTWPHFSMYVYSSICLIPFYAWGGYFVTSIRPGRNLKALFLNGPPMGQIGGAFTNTPFIMWLDDCFCHWLRRSSLRRSKVSAKIWV